MKTRLALQADSGALAFLGILNWLLATALFVALMLATGAAQAASPVCGGQDLVFPHHENEIAQSEAVTGKTFVKYWLHNGFININNHKMSKSAGNFFTIRDIASKYKYDVIRFFILSSHYRSPINFSDELLEASGNALERIRNCVESINYLLGADDSRLNEKLESSQINSIDLFESVKIAKTEFSRAMDDDLNTADAIAAVFDLVRDVNSCIKDGNFLFDMLKDAKSVIIELCGVLGIVAEVIPDIPAEVITMAEERVKAKSEKNYALADDLRKKIRNMGYEILDTKEGYRITGK